MMAGVALDEILMGKPGSELAVTDKGIAVVKKREVRFLLGRRVLVRRDAVRFRDVALVSQRRVYLADVKCKG